MQTTTLPAINLRPGMIILKAGNTTHSPITVTAVIPTALPGYVRIDGFNGRDKTPRMMFRSLDQNLPITILG